MCGMQKHGQVHTHIPFLVRTGIWKTDFQTIELFCGKNQTVCFGDYQIKKMLAFHNYTKSHCIRDTKQEIPALYKVTPPATKLRRRLCSLLICVETFALILMYDESWCLIHENFVLIYIIFQRIESNSPCVLWLPVPSCMLIHTYMHTYIHTYTLHRTYNATNASVTVLLFSVSSILV